MALLKPGEIQDTNGVVWSTEAPLENGYYWFYGRDELENVRAMRCLEFTLRLRLIVVGGNKDGQNEWYGRPLCVYSMGPTQVDPVRDQWVGYWTRINPPTPPENLLEGLDKMEPRG